MNIAVSSLILLIILLPGIIFRLSIIKSDSFENPLDTSKIAELVFVLIPSLLFHIASFGFLNFCGLIDYSQMDNNLEQYYYLLVGSDKLSFKILTYSTLVFLLKYVLILCITAGIFGGLLKKIIIRYNLDLRYSIISISNEWDNILSGRIFLYQKRKEIMWEIRNLLKNNFSTIFKSIFSNTKSDHYILLKQLFSEAQNLKIDFIDVDVLLNSSGKNFIYQGTLSDYFLASGNSMDKLYIINPSKKEINKEEIAEFKPILSDTLVIKNENIINLNFRINWHEQITY